MKNSLVEMLHDGHSIKENIGNILILAKGDKFGLFDTETEELLLLVEYTRCDSKPSEDYETFDRPICFISKDGGAGLFDYKAKRIILPTECNGGVTYVGGSHYLIRKDGKTGLFDDEIGEIILPIEYTSVQHFRQSNYLIEKDDDRGVFEADNKKVVVPTGYRDIERFRGSVYQLIRKDGKRGLFNLETSEIILPAECDNVEHLRDSICSFVREGKIGLVNIETGEASTLV
jgi:hypothetical protein